MKKCPHCGAVVADDAVVCPACHTELDLTVTLPRLAGSYCPSCGSLVPEGAAACPSCGMLVEAPPVRPPAPEGDDADEAPVAEETNRLPRIESAVPSEEDLRDPYLREHPIRMRAVVVSIAACLAVVGGAVLLITHPWDPNAFSSRATAPADTSQAGFPGAIDSLTGQDSRGGSGEVKSGDEATYETLSSAYASFGDLSKKLDDSIELLESRGFSGDAKERQEGQSAAVAIGVEISNAISDVQNADTTSGTYATQKEELVKMGNWLRNRYDIVSAAWSQAASSTDPQSVRSSVLAPVRGEASSYASLFNQAYSSFSIQAPDDRTQS